MLQWYIGDKKWKCTVILALMVVTVVIVCVFPLTKRKFDFVLRKEERIEIGRPCTAADVEKLTEKSWQCYLYGEASYNRTGMWIIPEVRMVDYEAISSDAVYTSFLYGWNTFHSLDGIFSFRYPRVWKVNTANWKGFHSLEILEDPGDMNSAVTIEVRDNRGENGALTGMDEEIQRIESASSVIEQAPIDLHGSPAVVVRTAPKITTDYGYTHIFVPKDKYFIHAFAVSSGDILYEFPRQLLLSSLRVE